VRGKRIVITTRLKSLPDKQACNDEEAAQERRRLL
jgi:hypothetical protein